MICKRQKSVTSREDRKAHMRRRKQQQTRKPQRDAAPAGRAA